MAMTDYMLCDHCGAKCIYDGDRLADRDTEIMVFCNASCAKKWAARLPATVAAVRSPALPEKE